VGSHFGANINMGEQRLAMFVSSNFTVVNLHNLWMNYPRSICHFIGRVYEKHGETWGQAQILFHSIPFGPSFSGLSFLAPRSFLISLKYCYEILTATRQCIELFRSGVTTAPVDTATQGAREGRGPCTIRYA